MEAKKLQEWISEHTIEDEMFWKGPAQQQLRFVRDNLRYLVATGTKDREAVEQVCTVISQHISKSITLPVYSLHRPDLGLRIILRDNFYNWKLSVISEAPISCNFEDIFHCHPPGDPDYTGDSLHPVYFEGFPADLIFGYYFTSGKRKWSAEINGDHRLYMTIFLILRSLGVLPSLRYSVRKD